MYYIHVILDLLLKHIPAFDDCAFNASSQHELNRSMYHKFQLNLMLDISDLMEFDSSWAAKVLHGVAFNALVIACYEIMREKIQDESALLPEYFFLNLGFSRIPPCFYLDFKSVFHTRSYLCTSKQPVIVTGIISREYETMLEL
jgi:hypothetical protein